MSILQSGALIEGEDLQYEYRTRKKEYIEKTWNKGDVIPDIWEVRRETKNTIRTRKKKEISVALEDKTWVFFHDIGVQKLSSKQFSILIRETKGVKKPKQLDVLAIDDEIVFIVECKSKTVLGKKHLDKDIAEYAQRKTPIENAIRRLTQNRDLKFVHVFVTENIEWYENDKIDAEDNGILIWDEYDLLGLNDLAKLAGEGAKYQVYNRVFSGKRIRNFNVTVPAIRAIMGGYTYYSFVTHPQDLLKIGYVHHRTPKSNFLNIANSYQRMISKNRVRQIEQFVKGGGFFPSSIIINFKKDLVEEYRLEGIRKKDILTGGGIPVVIKLPPYFGCAWIIDGQHRLYGYADISEKSTETVPVIAFVDIDKQHLRRSLENKESMEAKIFVDINKNQKAIQAALLWDLYEDLYPSSDDDKEKQLYTISVIAKRLNSDKDSPFYNHIDIPKERNFGNVSLYSICNSIKQQRLISSGDELLFHNSYQETINFATDRIKCFFNIIKENFPNEWDSGDNHYFRTSAGVTVFFGIFRDIIENNVSNKELKNINLFKKAVARYLDPLLIYFISLDKDTIDSYRGVGGVAQKSREVRKHLTEIILDANIGFRSIWFDNIIYAPEEKDRFKKEKEGLAYYLNLEESSELEFKGSLALNINRYFFSERKELVEEESVSKDGVLKSIVGFLNSKGGEIVIGILEENKYEKAEKSRLSEFPVLKGKILLGIDLEYQKDEWDGYLQKLTNLIESNISTDVLDEELIAIIKIEYDDRPFCLIRVKSSDSKQFLNQRDFYVRRMNKTVVLRGPKIDDYWKKARKKI